MSATSPTARIPSSTQTHAGVSSLELDAEVVIPVGTIRRVVVCSTVAVVITVVGSVVVSMVVVVAVVVSWAPALIAPARRTPAAKSTARIETLTALAIVRKPAAVERDTRTATSISDPFRTVVHEPDPWTNVNPQPLLKPQSDRVTVNSICGGGGTWRSR